MIELRMDRLAIVIPALNEGATIASVVDQALKVGSFVVVVDDGSTDGTGEIAKSHGANVVRHAIPGGYDAAIAAGLNFAFTLDIDVAVTCDADGQHRMEDVRRVSKPTLEDGYDYCAGIRNHYNRPIEAVLGLLARPLFGTSDPFCGLRAYHRKFFERFGRFPAEMNIGTLPMAWAKKARMKFMFVPIEVLARADNPRFAKQLRASWILTRAFAKSVKSYWTA